METLDPVAVQAVRKLFRDLGACNRRSIVSSGNIDIGQLAILLDTALQGPHRDLVVRGIAEVVGASIDGTALQAPRLTATY